jgi:tripartite-type tricarboxylate transporter receptor subunit TctC
VSERITRRELLERCAAMCGGLAIGRGTGNVARVADGMTAAQTVSRRTNGGTTCLEGARIRWIVGWTPGGGFDAYSRLAEPFIERALGAQIAIDNLPGAGGLVGALTLSRARADGRTLGILNGSGFLWNRNPDSSTTPDLSREFTVLARVSRRQQVIMANPATGVRSVADLIALSRRRAIVAAITGPDSSNFATLAAVTDLLGVSTEYVAGYPGSREVILGLLRGDCDITSVDIETFGQVPDLARMNPVLQITPERSADARIPDVPHLAGPTGLISLQPELFVGDAARARSLAAAIAAYLEFGRLFAGPGGMEPMLRDCLEQGMYTALMDPGFAEAARRAGRSIDIVAGADVRRGIPAVTDAVRPIVPVAAAAALRIR